MTREEQLFNDICERCESFAIGMACEDKNHCPAYQLYCIAKKNEQQRSQVAKILLLEIVNVLQFLHQQDGFNLKAMKGNSYEDVHNTRADRQADRVGVCSESGNKRGASSAFQNPGRSRLLLCHWRVD